MLVRFSTTLPCCMDRYKCDIAAHLETQLKLKGQLAQASELPEANEWPVFGHFFEAINRCAVFCTCGCTVSRVVNGGHVVPFVDITFSEPRLRASSGTCHHLSEQFHGLNGRNVAKDFAVELGVLGTTLPKGEEINFVRLWFFGARSDARDAFNAILDVLAQQNIGEYQAIVERERSVAARVHRRETLMVAVFLLMWLGFSCCGATLAGSQFGWVAGIVGFVGGLLAFPALFLFYLYMDLISWRVRKREQIGTAITAAESRTNNGDGPTGSGVFDLP